MPSYYTFLAKAEETEVVNPICIIADNPQEAREIASEVIGNRFNVKYYNVHLDLIETKVLPEEKFGTTYIYIKGEVMKCLQKKENTINQ